MPLADRLIPEFEHEMRTTRRLLARVPWDRIAWRPHERSMTLGRLATHIAELPRWALRFEGDSFETSTDSAPEFAGLEVLLTRFDENVSAAREAIAAHPQERWGEPLTVTRKGAVFFTLQKKVVLRSVMLNHLIHHRGQLSVYLRLNDVPLPPIYGPSADEAG